MATVGIENGDFQCTKLEGVAAERAPENRMANPQASNSSDTFSNFK